MGFTPETVRLGLLGCADVAVRRVLPAADRSGAVRLTATASRDPDRARAVAERFGGRAVEGYGQLLAEPGVEAVYLPLPSGLHAAWIERALRAGKHVLCEKPLTTSAADTEALHALAVDRGLVLRENYMFLHHRLHDRVASLVAEGAVGEVRSFRASFTIPPRPEGDIRLRPELGGGALLDTAGYPVRAALRFLGPELRPAGAFLRGGRGAGVDLGGAALFEAPGGVAVQCEFGMEHHYTSAYRFLGSKGSLDVGHVFTTPPDHSPVVRVEGPSGVHEETVPADDQFANSLESFAGAVRGARSGTDPETRTQAGLIDLIRAAG